jgi:glucosamine--fructose-6-phosphate aminotransferase (isomerizing)
MSDAPATFMRREVEEIPAAVRRLLAQEETLSAAGAMLAGRDPAVLVTVARGSSDHAASYLKYATELTVGIPVASLGPSIASLYHARLRLERAVCIAISQSGRSPDIVTLTESARKGGAATLALTNAADSPLGNASDRVVDIQAGPEKSVAATKSFVTSVVAGLSVLAHWQNDTALLSALDALPEQLEAAIACDWSALIAALEGRKSLFILGRGPAIAIANEAALKFKETCGMHAEAYSAAEVLHGPVTIVGEGFPVIALAARDAAEEAMVDTIERIVEQGAIAFATTEKANGATLLPYVATGHPLTDPLVPIASFYAFIEGFARHRGFNPDSPPHLRKITETV